jgi:hypothetical protein
VTDRRVPLYCLAAGRRVAPIRGSSRVHAGSRPAAAQGFEVSFRDVLQNLLLQRQLYHQPLQPSALPLQLIQQFGLVEFWSAEFLPPGVVAPRGHVGFFAGLRNDFPIG